MDWSREVKFWWQRQSKMAEVYQLKNGLGGPGMQRNRLPCPSESEEQQALFRFLAYRVEEYPVLDYLFAIPNGGWRNKATAGRLKAEGVKAGVPDLCLPVARHGFHGLYIEMKVLYGGASSMAQKEWHARLRAQGYQVTVCHGWLAAARCIFEYLGIPGEFNGA